MASVDSRLLEILACPVDHGPLLLVAEDRLYNPRLRRAYRVEEGIPVLLQDESEEVSEAQHERYMAAADEAN